MPICRSEERILTRNAVAGRLPIREKYNSQISSAFPTNFHSSQTSLFCPLSTKDFRLLEDCLCCLFLFVRWVAVFAKDSLLHHAQFGTNGLVLGPIDGDVFTNRFC